MNANALQRRLDRLTRFAGGPPQPPYLRIERVIVERRKDGSLWRKPYRRCLVGQPLSEMLNDDWEQIEPPAQDDKCEETS